MTEISFSEIKALLTDKYNAKIKWHESEMQRLIKEKEAALSAMAVSESTFEEPKIQPVAARSRRTRFSQPMSTIKPIFVESTTKTARERIVNQLKKMSGNFGRMELLKLVNKDGFEKEVKEGTFGIYFAELVKSNVIIEVEKSKGNNPSVYRRESESQDTRLPGI